MTLNNLSPLVKSFTCIKNFFGIKELFMWLNRKFLLSKNPDIGNVLKLSEVSEETMINLMNIVYPEWIINLFGVLIGIKPSWWLDIYWLKNEGVDQNWWKLLRYYNAQSILNIIQIVNQLWLHNKIDIIILPRKNIHWFDDCSAHCTVVISTDEKNLHTPNDIDSWKDKRWNMLWYSPQNVKAFIDGNAVCWNTFYTIEWFKKKIEAWDRTAIWSLFIWELIDKNWLVKTASKYYKICMEIKKHYPVLFEMMLKQKLQHELENWKT